MSPDAITAASCSPTHPRANPEVAPICVLPMAHEEKVSPPNRPPPHSLQQPPAPLPPHRPALCTQVPRERGSPQTGGNGGFIYGRSCHPSPSAVPWPLLRFALFIYYCFFFFSFFFSTRPSSLPFPFRAGDARGANPQLQPRSPQGPPTRCGMHCAAGGGVWPQGERRRRSHRAVPRAAASVCSLFPR